MAAFVMAQSRRQTLSPAQAGPESAAPGQTSIPPISPHTRIRPHGPATCRSPAHLPRRFSWRRASTGISSLGGVVIAARQRLELGAHRW